MTHARTPPHSLSLLPFASINALTVTRDWTPSWLCCLHILLWCLPGLTLLSGAAHIVRLAGGGGGASVVLREQVLDRELTHFIFYLCGIGTYLAAVQRENTWGTGNLRQQSCQHLTWHNLSLKLASQVLLATVWAPFVLQSNFGLSLACRDFFCSLEMNIDHCISSISDMFCDLWDLPFWSLVVLLILP